MSAVKLALIQMRSGVDPERNLDDAEALIAAFDTLGSAVQRQRRDTGVDQETIVRPVMSDHTREQR